MPSNAALAALPIVAAAFMLAAPLAAAAGSTPADASSWERSVVVAPIAGAAPGVSPHGINGLAFGPDGALYTASLIGPGIHRIDLGRGRLDEFVGAPQGEADDLAFAPDGTLAWTALTSGELRVRRPDGRIETLAANLPLVNPVHFTADGRLFSGQIGPQDSLLELDPAGHSAPRVIARSLGGINAFTDDGQGRLYVPLGEQGAIGRVDAASGALTIVARGLGQPVAVKRDAAGRLYAIDWHAGRVLQVDATSGAVRELATVTPPLDNLAVGPDGTIYVSRPSDNGIVAIDPASGAQRSVVQGRLAAPGGLAFARHDGRARLWIADAMGWREADVSSGAVTLRPFDLLANGSSAIALTTRTIVLGYVRRATVAVLERDSGRVQRTLPGLRQPMGVVALEDGTIYVVDYASGELLRFAPGAGAAPAAGPVAQAASAPAPAADGERTVVARDLAGPVGLAIDARGRLLVAEATAGRILRIDPRDGRRTVLARYLAQPEGIAVLRDGRIAVAEVGAQRLALVPARGGRAAVIATDLPVGQVFTRAPPPVYLPTGVAAGDDGTIYVSCDRDASVIALRPRRRGGAR